MSARGAGEDHFERWAAQNGAAIRRIRESKTPRPDYWLRCGASACVIEIKDLEPNASEKRFAAELERDRIAYYRSTPGGRLEGRIRKANRQYIRWKARRIPCITLIFNNTLVLSSTSGIHVFAGMFGRLGFSVSIDRHEDEAKTIADNGPIQARQNTSTSAVAVVEWNHDHGYMLLLYHNPYAAHPLPAESVSSHPGVRQFRVRKAGEQGQGFWTEIKAAGE